MPEVILTPSARAAHDAMDRRMQQRLDAIFVRLAGWPEVSGAKPLRGELQGQYRVRTGSYRVVFEVSPDGSTVSVTKVGNRRDVYD